MTFLPLGGATKNRNDPISVAPPKVAKASSHVTVAVTDVIVLYFANGNTA